MKATTRPGRGFVADYYLGTKRVRRSFKTAALRDEHVMQAKRAIDRDLVNRGFPSKFLSYPDTPEEYLTAWLGELEQHIADARHYLRFRAEGAKQKRKAR